MYQMADAINDGLIENEWFVTGKGRPEFFSEKLFSLIVDNGGTGSFEMTGGSLITRTGVRVGDQGTFAVIGHGASQSQYSTMLSPACPWMCCRWAGGVACSISKRLVVESHAARPSTSACIAANSSPEGVRSSGPCAPPPRRCLSSRPSASCAIGLLAARHWAIMWRSCSG